ncbi:MAG: hypothetical protein IT493_15485 [Gammaproteobacteria bacterium]|nr:hypothetical protein [Gammaproteobacteria bacterium]
MARSVKRIARQKVRSRVAQHPLLGKGGAHGKTRKAERKRDRQQLAREPRE